MCNDIIDGSFRKLSTDYKQIFSKTVYGSKSVDEFLN